MGTLPWERVRTLWGRLERVLEFDFLRCMRRSWGRPCLPTSDLLSSDPILYTLFNALASQVRVTSRFQYLIDNHLPSNLMLIVDLKIKMDPLSKLHSLALLTLSHDKKI